MKVRDIQQILESWAPKEIAWERDNPGLQAGDPAARVRGILVALDVTEEVIAEAVRRKANLLVSHHPLLFRPLSAVTMQSVHGRCIRLLMQSGINLYSAHTNLDFTRGGTSFALGRALGAGGPDRMTGISPMRPQPVTPYRPAVGSAITGSAAPTDVISRHTGVRWTPQQRVDRAGRAHHVGAPGPRAPSAGGPER